VRANTAFSQGNHKRKLIC